METKDEKVRRSCEPSGEEGTMRRSLEPRTGDRVIPDRGWVNADVDIAAHDTLIADQIGKVEAPQL